MRRCSPASTGCRRTRLRSPSSSSRCSSSGQGDLRESAMIAEEREKYNLLPDLPQELADGLADYYTEAIEAGVYSRDGGSEQAARRTLRCSRNRATSSPDELKVEDFWYFAPLEAAKEKPDERRTRPPSTHQILLKTRRPATSRRFSVVRIWTLVRSAGMSRALRVPRRRRRPQTDPCEQWR